MFFLVYERTELMNELSIQPHLWTYHSRITLEHLAQTLQEKKMKEKHPILYEFLQAVSYSNYLSLVPTSPSPMLKFSCTFIHKRNFLHTKLIQMERESVGVGLQSSTLLISMGV